MKVSQLRLMSIEQILFTEKNCIKIIYVHVMVRVRFQRSETLKSLKCLLVEEIFSFFSQENMFLIIFLPLHLFWKEKNALLEKKAIFRVVYYLRLNHVGLIWRNFQSQSFWRGWGCLNLDAFLSRIWGSRGCVQFGLFGVVLLKYHL